jgi:hypothetical protein
MLNKKSSVLKSGAQSSGLSISEKTPSAKAPHRPLMSDKADRRKAPSVCAVAHDLAMLESTVGSFADQPSETNTGDEP